MGGGAGDAIRGGGREAGRDGRGCVQGAGRVYSNNCVFSGEFCRNPQRLQDEGETTKSWQCKQHHTAFTLRFNRTGHMTTSRLDGTACPGPSQSTTAMVAERAGVRPCHRQQRPAAN